MKYVSLNDGNSNKDNIQTNKNLQWKYYTRENKRVANKIGEILKIEKNL